MSPIIYITIGIWFGNAISCVTSELESSSVEHRLFKLKDTLIWIFFFPILPVVIVFIELSNAIRSRWN